MTTDLASLLSALTAQPGIATQVSTKEGLAGTADSGVVALNATMPAITASVSAPAKLALAPGIATGASISTTFQAALALQAQTQAPGDRSTPVRVSLAGFSAQPSAQDPASAGDTSAMPPQRAASSALLALAPALVKQPTPDQPILAAASKAPIATSPIEAAAPAVSDAALPASPAAKIAAEPATVAIPITRPAPIAVTADAAGKLPKDGNLLPVDPAPAAPRARVQPVAAPAKDPGDAGDEKPDPAIAADPSSQSVIALPAAVAPPLPTGPTISTTPATLPASTAATPAEPVTTGATTRARTPPRGLPAPIPSAAAAAAVWASPSVGTGPLPPRTASPAAPSPAPVSGIARSANIIAVPAGLPAQSVPVADVQPVPDPAAAAAPAQSAAVMLPAAALADLVPASPLPAGPSTASRLARQPGAARVASLAAPTASSATLSPSVNALPDPLTPTGTTASAPAPVTSPPQDFASLVDRLLEARATAQSATAPQQISTTVTHAEFGRVSLTFQQDTAGLSVSMTSADPGFAPAAQSAITVSAQAGNGQTPTASQLSSGHASNQISAANPAQPVNFVPGSSPSQGFARPDNPTPLNAPAAAPGGSFSPTSGGSQQPQSQSQSQAQPQQHPGFIAANRPPAAPGNRASGVTGTGPGIFA